jgi:hypothetical protein
MACCHSCASRPSASTHASASAAPRPVAERLPAEAVWRQRSPVAAAGSRPRAPESVPTSTREPGRAPGPGSASKAWPDPTAVDTGQGGVVRGRPWARRGQRRPPRSRHGGLDYPQPRACGRRPAPLTGNRLAVAPPILHSRASPSSSALLVANATRRCPQRQSFSKRRPPAAWTAGGLVSHVPYELECITYFPWCRDWSVVERLPVASF